MTSDTVICDVTDFSIANCDAFRAKVWISTDSIDISFAEEREWPYPDAVQYRPYRVVGLAGQVQMVLMHQVSYRCIRFIQRDSCRYTIFTDRAQIRLECAAYSDASRLNVIISRKQKGLAEPAKGLSGPTNRCPRAPQQMWRNVFVNVMYHELAIYTGYDVMARYRAAMEAVGRTGSKFWINRHFYHAALSHEATFDRIDSSNNSMIERTMLQIVRIIREQMTRTIAEIRDEIGDHVSSDSEIVRKVSEQDEPVAPVAAPVSSAAAVAAEANTNPFCQFEIEEPASSSSSSLSCWRQFCDAILRFFRQPEANNNNNNVDVEAKLGQF